jgi:hypothetical protein
MPSGSLSRSRLYAPFLGLVAIQALLVALLPSTSGSDDPAAQFAGGQPPGVQEGQTAGPGDGEAADGGTTDAPGDRSEDEGSPTGGAPDAGATGSAQRAEPGDGGGAREGGREAQDDGASGATAAAGDTGHCTEDGRQHPIVFHAPSCAPAWDGGDNGGATYRGVSEDEINVVWLVEGENEQVAAIASAAGADTSPEEQAAHLQVLEDFLNEYHEFSGREVRLTFHELEDCPQSPPDIPGCRAEVRQVMEVLDPFMLLWSTPIYPDIFDEFARAGVVSLGGAAFAREAFVGHRPYRWDLAMDGTQGLELTGEYYCKKMAGETASHAGQIIHPSIGARDTTERRLGIISREAEANVLAARRLAELVRECSGQEVPIVTYDTNLERAQEQAVANTAALVAEGVTTVVCNCDVIRPVFITRNFTAQNYFPEHLITGLQAIDFDVIGRLYDPEQWQRAFGLSHLAAAVDWDEANAERVSQAMGMDERICDCPVMTEYVLLAGLMLHEAGPDLTPQTLESAMFASDPLGGWEATGGDPAIRLQRFGEGDYTAISDVREVYWSASATSEADGDPGAYVPMNDGRRYQQGELTSDFEIPQPSR